MKSHGLRKGYLITLHLKSHFIFEIMVERGGYMAQKLSSESIFNKEFHVDFKGYSAVEVDQFLDDVIKDYEYFETVIKEQKELLERYETTLGQQRRQIIELEGKTRVQTEQIPSQFSHVDILKRISRLEEVVLSNKE